MFKLINKVVRVLIFSDFILLSGLGFISPIFAIFLTNNIKGGDMEVAGFAATVYWVAQSLVVLPIGRYLDRHSGEKDDLFFIIFGNFLCACAVFGYLWATLPWHIYVLQALYALGMGMNIPAYVAIFTRHVDRGREAFSWSIHTFLTGLGAGAAGALGGIIAQNFGFEVLFLGVSVFILLSSLLPIFILREMRLF